MNHIILNVLYNIKILIIYTKFILRFTHNSILPKFFLHENTENIYLLSKSVKSLSNIFTMRQRDRV